MSLKQIVGIAVVVIVGLVGMASIGHNDLGYRSVVKNKITGNNSVEFEQGLFNAFMSDSVVWADFLSYDFSAPDNSCDYQQKDGVKVQYQDGGKGVVCGMVRVSLPNDEGLMLNIHKTYRSEEGARIKMLNQYIPRVLNLTAGLVSSEEAYATKRAEYQSMVNDQLRNGIYKTRMVSKEVAVDVDAKGNTVYQKKEVPEIVYENGQPVYAEQSPFKQHGIIVDDANIKAQDFEERTLEQISTKRQAEMATVTAKANAKKAYWEEQEVIARGKKDVAAAEYKEKEAAIREVVQAEKEKEKAEIAAQQKVEVAVKLVEEQEQLKLAAIEEAERIKMIGDAEAHAKKVVMQADGALKEKLSALVQMNRDSWNAASKQKWTPEVQLGAGANGENGNMDAVQSLISMMAVNNAKQLNLDMKVKGEAK